MTRILVVIPGAQNTPAQRQSTLLFLATLSQPYFCLAPELAPYDPRCIRRFITALPTRDVIVLAFSAGVVGVAAALQSAWLQSQGIHIEALLALDGWLVPLFTPFPCYRLSHDVFTHQTSRPLGMGTLNFWAEPAVSHLDLWAYPGSARGWVVSKTLEPNYTTALEFIQERLITHGLGK